MQKFLGVTALVVAIPIAASAEPFTIDNFSISDAKSAEIASQLGISPSQASALAAQVNSTIAPLQAQFTSEINTKPNNLQFNPFLKAMANAGTATAKGVPVDYASAPDIFTLTASGGVGLSKMSVSEFRNLNLDASSQVPEVGASANISILLGLNLGAFGAPDLGIIDLSKLNLYVNYAGFNLPSDLDIDGKFTSFGMHGQYKLITETSVVPGGILRWGGLDLISGFSYSSTEITTDMPLPSGTQSQTTTFNGGNLQTELGWNGDARVGAKVKVFSIPFEAATSVQLLYLLTLFGGAGFDLNFGSSEIIANAEAPAVGTLRYNNGNAVEFARPTARLNLKYSAGPAVANVRVFGGAQINLFVLRIFAQATYETSDTLAAVAGVRIVW